jgi:phage-related protein
MTFNPANVFNFLPTSPATVGSRRPRLVKTQYGDGYEQRTKQGDINALSTWKLVLTDRPLSELLAIDNFLKALNGVDAFIWDAPIPFGPGWYICKMWDYTWSDGIMVGINATFEERNGPPLAAVLNWAGQDFESYIVGNVFSIGGASAHSGDCTLGPGFFGVDNLNWAADDFEVYAAGNVTGTISQSVNSGDTTLGVANFSYFIDDTVDWAGDDFESMTLGNAGTIGLSSVNVGDVDLLLTGSFASFPIPINYAHDDFEIVVIGNITAVTANTDVGDSTLDSGYFNP